MSSFNIAFHDYSCNNIFDLLGFLTERTQMSVNINIIFSIYLCVAFHLFTDILMYLLFRKLVLKQRCVV